MARKKKQLTIKQVKPLTLYPHQVAVEEAFATKQYDRFFLAWHRRAGKDVFGLDFARKRMEERTGTYWHLFPYHVQAKRAIWKGIDARDGVKFIDRAFPPHEREDINETDMSIDWHGSHWQMLGSDNYDRMVGSNPCGIVFSEWALCDPEAWNYIRPILVENKGWAMFITTFRGRNHAWRMFKTIEQLENWYADLRTINDTHKHDGSPIVSEEDIAKEIQAGMDESLIEQEFYCNPDAAITGTLFSNQYKLLSVQDAHAYIRDNRLLRVAWGIHEETLAAIVFRDRQIVAAHTFSEWNLVDAIQAVVRRHPHAPLIHHSEISDRSVFADIDGAGFVEAKISSELAQQHALAAAVLNNCTVTPAAKERLCDFAMSYAPYRQTHDDTDLTNFAIANGLAVMRTARHLDTRRTSGKPLIYASDRGVI